MLYPESVTINNPDTDYRRLDKSAFRSLLELLSDILEKYECTFAQSKQFAIMPTSDSTPKDVSKFDESFDNRAVYDSISFFISGRTPDKSKKLNIIVAFDFLSKKPTCNISINRPGITDAQRTDIIEAIGNFIYEAAKVELTEPQNEERTNAPTVDTKEKTVKKKIKINWNFIGKLVIALITLATAIFTYLASKGQP